jgi:tetratricopeptide (TPR) repeat protein
MTYLLHKDGYETRDIIIVNVVSFLMIVLFPISMSRLGTVTSVIVYIMALAVMAAFIMHPWIIQAVQLRQPLEANAGNVKEVTGNSNEETSLSIKQNIESSKVIQSSEDNEAGFDLEERISSINIDAIQLTDLNVQQEDDRQGLPEGNVVEEEAAADVEEVADVKDIIKEEEQEPEIDDNLPVVELNMEEVIDDKIEQVIIESSDDNDLVYEKSDIVSDEAVGEKPIKDQIFKDESKLSLETLVNPIESNEVLNLVGLGFDYKLQGRILEAGEAFAKAYELAQGEGMRCLLGLERVYLYKEIGSYSKAKEILNELVAFTQVEPAIIKEINKQIVYIEVLIRELTRLRMGNMPASSVPRLVRLKVAEEIELLESGRE